ncbi:MAG TPA: tRNA pseudouridine(38-40) synthase TruA [Actinomycetota bacterium]|nr:tRNA pseudouridine(38-40) synthase TruA [Actinomycetota bacterium]
MRVLKLVLAYDGTDFRGFARQRGHRTVQGVLEAALERILGEVPPLSAAGRTDAGVHARGQVVSFPVPPAAAERAEPGRVQRALNGILAPEVVVVRAVWAPAGFDARRSARAREYRYRIDVGPLPDPFTARYVWHRPGDPSLRPMRAAAGALLGEHDFASFCRRPEVGGTVRRLERLAVSRRGDRVEVLARANAFCHQMVRSLVGTLVAVGEGRLDPGEIPAILEARDRSRAGPVAPPHGLTLERVIYGPLTPTRSRR